LTSRCGKEIDLAQRWFRQAVGTEAADHTHPIPKTSSALVARFRAWRGIVPALVIAGVTLTLDQRVPTLFQSRDPANAPAGPDWLQEAGRDAPELARKIEKRVSDHLSSH
jgi:hypothetical protein